MSMDPKLYALTVKYSDRLRFDPVFSMRVKLLYNVIRTLDKDRSHENAKAEAYVLACVLEETHSIAPLIESPGHPGETSDHGFRV